MRTLLLLLAAAALAVGPATTARAVDIGLFDWAVNIDGAVAAPPAGDPIPAGVNVAGFDDVTGLGAISVSVSGAGAHFVGLFVDHDIDKAINTFFNEFGSATGAPVAGESWEIDEPGFVFGDIFTNLQGNSLDNTNGVPAGSEDDVSMALGWDYTLAAGETSAITFLISENLPSSGFYLTQTDPDSQASIYFSSTLTIRGTGGAVIPEPGTLALYGMGLGIAGLWGANRRRMVRL
jgi:hypothetical protein